jgi:hypothetical protein
MKATIGSISALENSEVSHACSLPPMAVSPDWMRTFPPDRPSEMAISRTISTQKSGRV